MSYIRFDSHEFIQLFFPYTDHTFQYYNSELTFITVENGGHGWWDKKTFDDISNSAKNFFLRNLNNNRDFKKEKNRTIVSEKLNYDKDIYDKDITNIEKQKNDK